MKELNTYIVEKFRISKDRKYSKKRDYYYMIPLDNELYLYCHKKYDDLGEKVPRNDKHLLGYTIFKDDLNYLWNKFNGKKYEKEHSFWFIYEIPEKYTNKEDFREDIRTHKLKIAELTKLTHEDII